MREHMKDGFYELQQAGLTEYGAEIHRGAFLSMFGIERVTDNDLAMMQPKEIRQALQGEALAELAAAGYVRDQLLKEGKYFARTQDVYRVALPSENAEHAGRYLAQANRKQRKARLLLDSTPKQAEQVTDNTARRLARHRMQHDRMAERIGVQAAQ